MGRRISILSILWLSLSGAGFAQSSFSAFDFIENKGQWDPQVKFRSEVPAGAFFLHTNGFTVLQQHPEDLARFFSRAHGHVPPTGGGSRERDLDKGYDTKTGGESPLSDIKVRAHTYRVVFEGAAAQPLITADKQRGGRTSYFLGNDPSKWAAQVNKYGGITYQNVYPNIDLRYYAENGQLKYDWIVRPGGKVDQIVMKYEGVEKLSVNRNKQLVIGTSVGELKELEPYSYQYENGVGKKVLDCRYEITDGNTVRFRVKNYNPQETLIIDPTIIFCTFSGGPNNWGFTATPGPNGTFFSGAIIFSADFGNVGPFTYQGGSGNFPCDMLILQYSADGTQLLHATYLGGKGNDFPHSLYSDQAGNLVILGRTYSGTTYPTNPGGTLGPGGGCDIVVTKLRGDFSGIIGSFRIGGSADDGVNMVDIFMTGNYGRNSILQNYGDESRSEVVLDNAGNIYVASNTKSSNFPTRGPASAFGGLQDGVVMKLAPDCNSVIWSSYLGGNGNDGAYVLEVNPLNGEVYVAGATSSRSGFPGMSGIPRQFLSNAYLGADADGFITRFSNNGDVLRSSYAGTGNTDIIYGIKIDRKGFPYIMGTTRGNANWPLVNASPVGSSPITAKQFVAKISPALDDIQFSTVFGSGSNRPNMSPVAFLVDRCENMYISGWGGWINPNEGDGPFDQGNVANMPLSADAFDNTTDNRDFYFIVIQKNAASLLYATYFGQEGGEGEHVDGGTSRFDDQGVIYQGICANCFGGNTTRFPTTPGVWAENNGAGRSGCNSVALKIRFSDLLVKGDVESSINGVVRNYGCLPLSVSFFDKTPKGTKTRYEWDFGDGQPIITTTDSFYTYTYTTAGDYQVRLVVTDSNSCNVNDTTFLNIRARTSQAILGLGTPEKVNPADCNSTRFRFRNTSVAPANISFQDTSFIWDFGDGSPRIRANKVDIEHTFPGPGTYIIKLTLSDTLFCNSPETISDTLKVASILEASFSGPGIACIGKPVTYTNTSNAGTDYWWAITVTGDPVPIFSTTTANLTYIFQNAGTYEIRLIAEDPFTCNPRDTLVKAITVVPSPVAAFNFSPPTPTVNALIRFENFSSNGAVRYQWDFGDGSPPYNTNSMASFEHEYIRTGTYKACLIAFNSEGCSDTTCKNVQALIDPLMDVPNAFTPGRPGGSGVNHLIKVKGFGIEKINWRIYNRWGVKVFESTNKDNGWDGTYNGQPQPMDVYMYILEVQFTDNTTARRTGDITLIR